MKCHNHQGHFNLAHICVCVRVCWDRVILQLITQLTGLLLQIDHEVLGYRADTI